MGTNDNFSSDEYCNTCGLAKFRTEADRCSCSESEDDLWQKSEDEKDDYTLNQEK